MSGDLPKPEKVNSEPERVNSEASASDNKWETIQETTDRNADQDFLAQLNPSEVQIPDSEEETGSINNESLEALLDQIKTEKAVLEVERAALEKEMGYLMAALQTEKVRAKKDLEDIKRYAGEKTVEKFLPLIDSYEESLNQSKTFEQLQEGITHIIALMKSIFEKLGVQAIEPSPGEVFDPYFQTAMATEEGAEGQAPNTIIKVLQKGYRLHKRVVRPAMVVVSKLKS